MHVFDSFGLEIFVLIYIRRSFGIELVQVAGGAGGCVIETMDIIPVPVRAQIDVGAGGLVNGRRLVDRYLYRSLCRVLEIVILRWFCCGVGIIGMLEIDRGFGGVLVRSWGGIRQIEIEWQFGRFLEWRRGGVVSRVGRRSGSRVMYPRIGSWSGSRMLMSFGSGFRESGYISLYLFGQIIYQPVSYLG